jgi:hypothetical protein
MALWPESHAPHASQGGQRAGRAGWTRPLAAWLVTLLLAACQNTPSSKLSVYHGERFQFDEAYSRIFDGPPEAACDASQRALLSQGYILTTPTRPRQLSARKYFQPDGDRHAQIEFNVNCVPDGGITTVFVSAVQENYVLRRNRNSASVGVSAIGSLSLPMGSSEDQLVKTGSETIPAGDFYDRFFALVQVYLRDAQQDQASGYSPR